MKKEKNILKYFPIIFFILGAIYQAMLDFTRNSIIAQIHILIIIGLFYFGFVYCFNKEANKK